jgi:hypothetical protein
VYVRRQQFKLQTMQTCRRSGGKARVQGSQRHGKKPYDSTAHIAHTRDAEASCVIMWDESCYNCRELFPPMHALSLYTYCLLPTVV